jgi:hypothetical protein
LSGGWEAQCRKYWQQLPRLNYSILYLGDWTNDYFPKSGEIRRDRLKVSYQTERSATKRPPDLYVKFEKVCPDGPYN